MRNLFRLQRKHLPFLFAIFCLKVMLIVWIFELDSTASAHSSLLAPVDSPLTTEMQALEYIPQPLNASVHIPNRIKVCMEASGERFDLLGTVQDQDKTYYLLGIYPDFVSKSPLDTTDELIVSDAQEGCERLVGINSVAEPMSFYMSLSTAQNLELQRYRHEIALDGGVAAFQQDLIAHISNNKHTNDDGGSYLLSNEQIQALHQLGVQFSGDYRLLQTDTFSH
jgi:hypothetical protein